MPVPLPGSHGGDAVAVGMALGIDPESILDLSASLNPFAPDIAGLATDHLDALVPYPDHAKATAALAEALGEDVERVVLTNGGSEAIALVADHLGTGHVVAPEFSLYERHLSSNDPLAGRWRSNPSNPLGHLAGAEERAVVWDEAFYPLATGEWTRGDDAWRLGSLTKLWSCAGLRLGFAIAPDDAGAAAIRARQPRWSVNGLALSLVPTLLEASDLTGWRDEIARTRSEFSTALRSLDLAVRPSSANWVLVDDVPELRSRMAPLGILVRDCSSFGMEGTVRIAIPAPERIALVVSAVEQCLH